MSKSAFFQSLQNEVSRIDDAKVAKRHERIIEGFTNDPSPKAIINGQEYRIFNSNDYLGLRHHPALKRAEAEASETYGAGPGAVRFISGTMKVYRELEQAVAKFHGRDDGMVFSSAFATNMAVLFSLIKPQSKDSVMNDSVLVISDELNHRSIIDGIRIANLPKDSKAIFPHLNAEELRNILQANVGKFSRVIVVTDGVFSMLGEFQDLAKLRAVMDEYDAQYEQGVLLIVDDAHGVGASGATGRGTEEVTNGQADILIGTFGKGFGADGGYVVADQVIIDYLRESAATYIYSNSISPATAGAALEAVKLLDEPEGRQLISQLADNLKYFKDKMTAAGFQFAADSSHAVQPVLFGDPALTKAFKEQMFEAGFIVTNINYPVVPKGRDEIRVQLSATHTREDIDAFIEAATKVGKNVGVI